MAGVDLQTIADRGVHQRPRAPAERRRLGGVGQSLDLTGRNGKRQLAYAIHQHARHGQKLPPADAVDAGTVDRPEQLLQLAVASSVPDALYAHSRSPPLPGQRRQRSGRSSRMASSSRGT